VEVLGQERRHGLRIRAAFGACLKAQRHLPPWLDRVHSRTLDEMECIAPLTEHKKPAPCPLRAIPRSCPVQGHAVLSIHSTETGTQQSLKMPPHQAWTQQLPKMPPHQA